MKRILTLFLGLMATVGTVSGQILTFEFSALTGSEVTATSNFNNANLTSSTISRGAGLTASANSGRFNATNWALTSIDNAVSGNDYMEFTITPNSGFQFDVTSIVVQWQRSATGNTAVALRSSADSYSANLGGIQAIVDNTTTQALTFTFTQSDVTTATTYRIYSYSEAAGGSGGPGDGPADDIVINGTVESSIVAVAPTVTTGTSGSLTTSGATISGNEVTSDGGGAITQRGVAYGTATSPKANGTKVTVAGTTGLFDAVITGLSSNTLYYVRAYAINSADTSYGSQISFTTSVATAIIETGDSSLLAFTTEYGSASSLQSFTVSGVDLTGNLTVTPPSGFQVSDADDGTFGSTLTLVQETGNVSATVYVRLAASNIPGSYSGDITVEGGSADAVNVEIPSSTVSERVLTVSDAAVTSKTYNGTTAATITGTLVGVLDGDTVTLVGTGTFASANAGEGIEVSSTSTLTGAQALRYSLTQPTGLTGTITKATNNITFATLATQELQTGSLSLTATATSGETVTFASSNTGVATVSDNTVTFVSAGTTTITASQAGNINYNAATPVDRVLTISASVLIAGWDFQTTTNGGTLIAVAPSTPKVFQSNFGIATMYLDGTNGSSDWINATTGNEVTAFGGSTLNSSTGFSSTTTNGALALIGGTSFSANGKAIVFAFDMSNRKDLLISYASQKTASGFNSQTWSYSTDLNTWTALDPIATVTTSFAAITLPTITGLDGVKTAYVRFVGTGATGSTGNNRLDNIQFRATENKTLTLSGNAGYRLMSSPVSGTYGNLIGGLWTQGFTGADATNGTSNVYIQQAGNTLSTISNQGASYPAGYGVAVGVYADDDASTPGVQGGFPKVLSITGTENTAPVAITPAFGSSEGNWEYVLAGNPFWSTIDWESVEKGADVSSTIWVWSQSAGNYVTWNGSVGDLRGGLIAPGQGFFAAYDGAASGITFTQASKTSGGSFRGKEAEVFAVRLALRDGTRENSTWLQFAEDGTFARDKKDAVKFAPLSSNVFQLFTKERESNAEMDIHYLPILTETLELPLGIRSSSAGSFTLAATDIRLPQGWTLSLRDESTGDSQSVNMDSQIVMNSQGANYTLVIEPSATTSVDAGRLTPDAFALSQNYPNPFNPSTQIRFTIGTQDLASLPVRLRVYDILGREVAVLVDGVLAQGSHSVNFDASAFTSGVYLYKLEAGGMVLTRRMTLVK